jgi:hypothetical protein
MASRARPARREPVKPAALMRWSADQLGRAGVRRVSLDHHRAAGRQGRGGVTAGHREGQGEVRGAEHGHGAQRHVAQAQVGTRQRLAVGLGRVDAGFQPAAVAQHAGEHLQLAHGAAALAFQAGAGKAGLGHGANDQLVADRLDLGGDSFQEHRALLGRGGAVGAEGGRGQGGRLVQVGLGRAAERDLQRGAGAGIDREDRAAGSGAGAAVDQKFTSDGQGAFPQV